MSLKDQMLKAGLVSQKQATKASKKKKKSRTLANEIKADVAAKREAECARSKALNEAQQAEKREREVIAQINQLITLNHITYRGDEKYNFVHDNKIKTLYVTDAIRRSLLNGQLLVVIAEQGYQIIPAGVGEKIAQRAPDRIILVEPEDKTQISVDEDDPYKDFIVPDDLMW